MATFTRADKLQGAEFVGTDLSGARFVRADLSGVVMRGVDVQGADIDSPWLFDGESFLRVNGVDVIPLVDAELNRRFPGRAGRRAEDPDGLRAAWAALERTWSATLDRAAAMPAGNRHRPEEAERTHRIRSGPVLQEDSGEPQQALSGDGEEHPAPRHPPRQVHELIGKNFVTCRTANPAGRLAP